MTCPKPFRLLHLPSLAHDVIFSLIEIGDVYRLSKCSTRSRYAVKMFTKYQKYSFEIDADESRYCLRVWSDDRKNTFCHQLRSMDTRESVRRQAYSFNFLLITYCEDYWAAAKEEILYFLDVFTRKVNHLSFYDVTKVIETTEFLKSATPLPAISCIYYYNHTIDDEVYKYVLRQLKHAKMVEIGAPPSAEFRFDEMEPFTGDSVFIDPADWVTVDHLIRCFLNVEKVELRICRNLCQIIPTLMHQFFTAWQKESRIKDLELECDWSNIEFQAMFENVPKTVVKRIEVESVEQVFQEGQCFLIRQESGVEAIAYRCFTTLCFKTNFRLLRDDE